MTKEIDLDQLPIRIEHCDENPHTNFSTISQT